MYNGAFFFAIGRCINYVDCLQPNFTNKQKMMKNAKGVLKVHS